MESSGFGASFLFSSCLRPLAPKKVIRAQTKKFWKKYSFFPLKAHFFLSDFN